MPDFKLSAQLKGHEADVRFWPNPQGPKGKQTLTSLHPGPCCLLPSSRNRAFNLSRSDRPPLA